MDANFLSPSLNTSPGGALQTTAAVTLATASPGATLRGADFANLLGSMLADPGRQGLAAAGLAEAGLQAVPLGPQIELITAVAPVPDTGSLMAFARSQGLDESTLAALFGDMAAQAPAGAGGLSSTAATVGRSYFLDGQTVLAPSLTAQEEPLPVAVGSFLPAQIALAQPQAPISTATTEPSLLLDNRFTSAAVLVDAVAKPAHAVTVATTKDAALAAVAATDVAWQVTKPPVQSLLTGANTLAAAGEIQPTTAEDAMQDALRVQLQLPREAVTALTRRLATMSGNGQAQVWGNLTTAATATAAHPSLDMRAFFTPAGLLAEPTAAADAADALQASDADADSLSTLPVDASRKAAGSLTLTPEAVVPSQAGQRAEHYQQLADRLGQALAQRLQAQIERGEWKMQMRMDPVSLGRIDLELDMRAGGLDAIFRSDNPLTRELIAQGLPKLRDSLAQSGTAVANVWVNGDSARQSGGNPTPSQTPRSSPPNPSNVEGEAGQSIAGVVPAGGVRQGGSSGAWDVLA
jgi:flagellar hook-length control protein FliK